MALNLTVKLNPTQKRVLKYVGVTVVICLILGYYYVTDERMRAQIASSNRTLFSDLPPCPPSYALPTLYTPPVLYTKSANFSAEERQQIDDALAYLNLVSCVNLTAVDHVPSNCTAHLAFEPHPSSCHTTIGRPDSNPVNGTAHRIHLTPYCVHQRCALLHEVLHALGFPHEHSRPDRDQYIAMDWANLSVGVADGDHAELEARWWQFVLLPRTWGDSLPYDYYSVMHYPPTGHNDQGRPVYSVLKPDVIVDAIGQQSALTELDVAKLNAAYRCPADLVARQLARGLVDRKQLFFIYGPIVLVPAVPVNISKRISDLLSATTTTTTTLTPPTTTPVSEEQKRKNEQWRKKLQETMLAILRKKAAAGKNETTATTPKPGGQ